MQVPSFRAACSLDGHRAHDGDDVARQRIWLGPLGQIAPREPLPSISYIKAETGLAVGTIRHAIELLTAECWAYTVPGRGTYAAKPPAG